MPTKWLQERPNGPKNDPGMPPRRAFCGITSSPVATSKIFTSLSLDPLTTRFPSGENFTAHTRECPLRVRTCQHRESSLPRRALRGGISNVNFEHSLSTFGNKCPQNGSKNEPRAPRTSLGCPQEGPSVVDNLLVRIHFIIVMIRWTGLAPWEVESPFSR